jgi:anti-anti-sigma regulatory factor
MSFAAQDSLYHVDCDLRHFRRADLRTVDALARAHVNARRLGTRLCIVNASPELQKLIAFAGLTDVLFGRSEGQTEEREQPLGVEEGCEADDSPV